MGPGPRRAPRLWVSRRRASRGDRGSDVGLHPRHPERSEGSAGWCPTPILRCARDDAGPRLVSFGERSPFPPAHGTTMITAELLTHISLFAQVPESERASLASRAADLRLRENEWLLVEGQAPAFYGLLEGRIEVLKTIGGQDRKLTSYGPGDYFGEVPLLLGSPAIASLRASEPSRVLRLEASDFMELVSNCPVLNAEISRTMADRVGRLRQVTVETPAAMIKVVGHPADPACSGLGEFLSRNRIPFTWREPGPGSSGTSSGAPPVIELTDGRRLEAPSFRGVANALGLQTEPAREGYDVVIVGGGPAGLGAAV